MTRRQPLCSCCKTVPPVNGQAYCAFCRNWIAQHKRPKYRDFTPEAKRKADARTAAKNAQRRGVLKPQCCEVCGSPSEEKHHDDYSQPLDVRWFCARHHREHHLAEKEANANRGTIGVKT